MDSLLRTFYKISLRAEYVAAVRESLTAHLENTYIVDEQGNKRKLKRRED